MNMDNAIHAAWAADLIQQSVDGILDECEPDNGELLIHASLPRAATRFVGQAEGIARFLELLTAIPHQLTLAAFGLCDVAPCVLCGEDAYHEAEAESDDDEHHWDHYGRPADAHQAVVVGEVISGYDHHANRRRFLRMIDNLVPAA